MPSNANSRVAILLATYNGAQYIREFLDSLCAQSFNDFCVYVRDDGSVDATQDILNEYSSRLSMRLLPSHGRLGPAKSFFKILEEAGDEYECYMFADQDDCWYADKVERALVALQNHRDEVLLYCSRLEYVDEHLRHLKYSRIPRLLTLENAAVESVATGCTVAITPKVRKEVLASKPYDFIMHDWWLYLFSAAFGRVVYDATPSIKYRQHGSNTIGAATGAIDDFLRRWARFVRRDGGVHLLSRQIKAFLDCYGGELAPRKRQLLDMLDVENFNFFKRLLMTIHSPFARQSRLDTLILRFIFLIGRY